MCTLKKSDKKESLLIKKNEENRFKCVILQLWSWWITCTLCRHYIKFQTLSGNYCTKRKITNNIEYKTGQKDVKYYTQFPFVNVWNLS